MEDGKGVEKEKASNESGLLFTHLIGARSVLSLELRYDFT